MKKVFTFCVYLLFSAIGFSQGTAGESAKYENRILIDIPTAGNWKKV